MSDKIYDPDSMGEGNEIEGGIAVAEWEAPKTVTSKSTGDQFEVGESLHIGIEPFGIEIHGKQDTGMFHEWYAYTSNKNSKYGKFLAALKKLGISIKSEKDLVGLAFVWQRQVFDFGDGMTSKPTWIPIAILKKGDRQTEVTQPSQSTGRRSTPAAEKPSFEGYKKQRQSA